MSVRAQAHRWAAWVAPKTWVWNDTYAVGAIHHLNTLLNEVVPVKTMQPTDPLYGFHFLFNTQSNTQMGSDGYDNYQAPVDEHRNELYKRRMWVGGTLEYMQSPPKAGDAISCIEKIHSVKCLGPNAFVNIGRELVRDGTTVMKETRTLLYTNEPFQEKVVLHAAEDRTPTHSTKVTFSLSQLMRFSALSYNLHKIHYDAAYCRQENLKTVIVSGPFMISAMLRYFSAMFPETAIKSFRYKNIAPCYIDEEAELRITDTGKGCAIELAAGGLTRCHGMVYV